MRIVEAIERGEVKIPISEVIGQGGIVEFVEETRDKGYFDVDFKGGELKIVAGNHVGQIPLTRDIAVHVKPKVALSNLARVIGVANQPVKCLDSFRRKYQITADASANITEAIARSLSKALRDLHVEGVYRQYVERSEILSRPRGRPNLRDYLRHSIAKAKPTRLPCSYHELTADTPYNRVIKRAIATIGESLASAKTSQKELVRELADFYDLLDPVSLQMDQETLRRVKSDLAHSRLPLLRHYYSDILDIALLVLEGHGVEIAENFPGERAAHSLIVNLEVAFENYVLQVLQKSAALGMKKIEVKDGNSEGKKQLFDDVELYEAKPDFVVSQEGVSRVIGDAKYKIKLAETDRYQLISHATSYRVGKAFFVSPAHSTDSRGPKKIGTIGGGALEIFQYALDLDSKDLLAEEEEFCNWVASLTPQPADA